MKDQEQHLREVLQKIAVMASSVGERVAGGGSVGTRWGGCHLDPTLGWIRILIDKIDDTPITDEFGNPVWRRCVPPPPPPTVNYTVLRPNEFLTNQPNPGSSELFSPNGRFKLSFRTDINLVLFRTSDNEPLWNSNTSQPGYPFPGPIWVAYMQDDGNFVIQVQGNTNPANVVFKTNTSGNPGSFLAIRDDGNVIVCTPAGVTIWATNT